MRLRSIRVAAIHELPLQCVVLHQSYKAHLQTEMVSAMLNIGQHFAHGHPKVLNNKAYLS